MAHVLKADNPVGAFSDSHVRLLRLFGLLRAADFIDLCNTHTAGYAHTMARAERGSGGELTL